MLDTTEEINKERKMLHQENMVFIAGGSFMMGSNKFYSEEKPVHKVTVDSFWMDQCPVTNKEFSDFVSATDHITIAERPLNPADFPAVPEENLVPGSMVFKKSNESVDLKNYENWWQWMKGASWKHPQGPSSTIIGLDDHPLNAKLVRETAEIIAPERIRHRHFDFSACGELVKQSVRLVPAFRAECDVEVVALGQFLAQ